MWWCYCVKIPSSHCSRISAVYSDKKAEGTCTFKLLSFSFCLFQTHKNVTVVLQSSSGCRGCWAPSQRRVIWTHVWKISNVMNHLKQGPGIMLTYSRPARIAATHNKNEWNYVWSKWSPCALIIFSVIKSLFTQYKLILLLKRNWKVSLN